MASSTVRWVNMLIYNDFVSLSCVLFASFLHRDGVETHGALRMLGESGWIGARDRHWDQCIGGSFCAKSNNALASDCSGCNCVDTLTAKIPIAHLVPVDPTTFAPSFWGDIAEGSAITKDAFHSFEQGLPSAA